MNDGRTVRRMRRSRHRRRGAESQGRRQ
jgi:hypothetical protein